MHHYIIGDRDELDYPLDRAIEAVEYLIHIHPTLVPYRDSLLNIAIASNMPDTGSVHVFQHISRVASTVSWLPDALSPYADPNMFPLLSMIDWHKSRTRYQRNKFHHLSSIRLQDKPWRSSSDFTPVCRAVAYFLPLRLSKEELSALRTLDQFRALILFSACRWYPSQNTTALLQLSRTIDVLMGRIPHDWSKRTPHPRLSDLSQIGDSITRLDLANALTACLSMIAEVDQAFANDLVELYIPLLVDDAIIEASTEITPIDLTGVSITPVEETPKPSVIKSPKPPRKKSKRERRSKTSEKTTIRIPAGIPHLPGESCDEASFALNASRRTEPSHKPIPLRDELQWAIQRVWGQNTLLIRDHIDSLSDAEAFLFGEALIENISRDISSNDQTAAITGIFVGLTFALGRVSEQLSKLKVIKGSLRASHDLNVLTISVRDGLLQIPVLRPESAFEATPEMQVLLEPTLHYVRVPLPPSLTALIRRASDRGYAFVVTDNSKLFEKSLLDLDIGYLLRRLKTTFIWLGPGRAEHKKFWMIQ